MSVDVTRSINNKTPRHLAIMEDDEASNSGSELSSSPSSKGLLAGRGSDLFKTVLEDYVVNETRVSRTEFERYKSRQQNRDRDFEEHAKSRRCESCMCVMAFCRCDMYNGGQRKFGHRVHWADEVWNKPLTTLLADVHLDNDSDLDEVDGHEHTDHKIVDIGQKLGHVMPKPILKHRATCIVIVSE